MPNIRHRKPTTTSTTDATKVVVNVDDSPPSVSDCESWERSFDDGHQTNGHDDDDDDDDISSKPSPLIVKNAPAAPTSTTTTTISSLDQFLSTYCSFSARTFTTDQGLKVLQWSLWALSYMTKSNTRNKHLSPSLRKLYLELSFTRYVLRFYGFLQSLEGYRSGSWAGGAWENQLIPKIAKYVLAGSMLFYYPLEHVAYIGWQVPQLVPSVNANKFSAISCWFWTVYIVGDFWMSCLKWKELKMKMSDLGERMLIGRTKRCADGDDVNEEKENTMAELQNEVLTIRKSIRHIRLQLTRCLLFILPCINWSLPNWATDPLLDEGPLNGLMLAEAYTSVYQSLCSMS